MGKITVSDIEDFKSSLNAIKNVLQDDIVCWMDGHDDHTVDGLCNLVCDAFKEIFDQVVENPSQGEKTLEVPEIGNIILVDGNEYRVVPPPKDATNYSQAVFWVLPVSGRQESPGYFTSDVTYKILSCGGNVVNETKSEEPVSATQLEESIRKRTDDNLRSLFS